MTPQINLKLDSVTLTPAPQQRMIHFVLATASPTTPGDLTITVLPGGSAIDLGHHATDLAFGSAATGGGLLLASTAAPGGDSGVTIKASLWVMQTRRGLKTISDVLTDITSFITGEGQSKVSALLTALENGHSFVLSNLQTIDDGLAQLGAALGKMDDKQLGYVVMDQTLELTQPLLTQSQTMASGNGQLSWSWVIAPTLAPPTASGPLLTA